MKIMKYKYLFVLLITYLLQSYNTEVVNTIEKSFKNGAILSHNLNTPNKFPSFLQVKENLEEKSEELSKLTNMMKTMMLTQQSNRKKKRYTEDGRLCASAFAQDGQTYFDCTSTRSPDGLEGNKEWCYVDANQKGDKPWDYCRPIMDYDKIREENQEQLRQFTIPARKLLNEIESEIGPGQSALDDLKKVRQGQAELDRKINQLSNELAAIFNNMQNLYNSQAHWEKLEEKAVEIATKIEEIKAKKEEEEANKFTKEMEKTEDTIKREVTISKATIATHVQQRILSQTADCTGMLAYEEDEKGDGIMGQYYDNEAFLGDYVEQKDPNIDFDWTGASPTQGINPSNFSVRWEGFIYCPITSNYQFAIECDDGASVTINNEIVVSHNMFSATEESQKRVNDWLNTEVEKRNTPSKNYNKSTSTQINLVGGTKYKIVVSYYHSVHNDIQDDEKSFIRLYWQSDDFEEILIKKKDFYTHNSFPPLKLSGFTSEFGVVRKLLENDLAFKNSEEYIIEDIPIDFVGLTTIKLNSRFLEKEISVVSNIPVLVYIGRLDHYPDPLPKDFENTQEFMSLLQINKPSALVSDPKKLESNRSGLVKIFKKKFLEGKIKIPLNTKSINAKGIPLILFFGFDNSTGQPLSCGGKELWITDPNSKHYKECTVSSYFNANYKCEHGLNGKITDGPGTIWATKNEGIGAWMKIEFQKLYQLSRIEYWDRKNPIERNSEIVVSFSNNDDFIMKTKNTDEMQEFKMDSPIKTNFVKFTVKLVYGTINNGGSFKLYGTNCLDADQIDKSPFPEATGLERVAGVNPKALPSLFSVEEKKPISLTCKDSFSNSKKLAHIKQTPGQKTTVRCLENCGKSRNMIYGDLKYSRDSAICKAAYHAQYLKDEGGLVGIEFAGGEPNFKAQIRNGVQSGSKGRSDVSLKFEKVDDKNEIIVQEGGKVDFRYRDKWEPGVIHLVKESPNNGKVISISIEGSEKQKEPVEVPYPNKTIVKPCGEKVKNRDCKGSRTSPNTNRPIKIRFVPKTYKKAGDYLVDSGETFGKSGKAYGWSQDMSGRIKTRSGGQKPELETLVEFPPSPKSKFCNRPKPDVLCDKVSWSVKAGHGKFSIKLYVGDPQANTRVDLKINDKYIVQQKVVNKGDLQIFEGAFDAVNEYLKISSDCQYDCDYAMSKLNMIEFYPFNEELKKEDNSPSPDKEDPCGNASEGGRCEIGPNVLHCLYEDPTAKGAESCSGNLMMVQVPDAYRCNSQKRKFKCVKREYKDRQECLKFCPTNCLKNVCE